MIFIKCAEQNGVPIGHSSGCAFSPNHCPQVQITRFVFARSRVDYSTLGARVRGQFLFGWTPNPGTSFYAGYNDDLNYRGFSPLTDRYEPGLQRNGRTFFLKMSYLIRRSIK